MPDGGLEVRFEVSGAAEMIPWLMGWGAAVEVLEPGWLREAIVATLKETLSIYRRETGAF
ncbi:MAG TPA: WYL domain-containing protein [Syntrophomonadaceae bacterium]|nr:WYL domain-containing protein [Syntrophomonadaceae bacterium]